MLKIHISKEKITNFWSPNNICILYIVLSSLAQIVEGLYDNEIHISHFFYMLMLVSLVMKCISHGKININFLLISIILLSLSVVYLGVYYTSNEINYPWALAAITCILTAPLLFKCLSYEQFDYWKKVEHIFIIYLIINTLLYFSTGMYEASMEGETSRFFGGSNNPNQFAIIPFSIMLINFNGAGIRHNFINFLSLFLILVSGSRLYLVVAFFVWLLSLVKGGKITLKKIYKFIAILLISMGVVFVLALNTGFLARLGQQGVSTTGRAYLYYSAVVSVVNSPLHNLLFGVNITDQYLQLTALAPSHSFAESSFFAMAVLFGLFGVGMFLLYFILLFYRSKSKIYRLVCFFVFLCFFFNDVMCYPQGFVCITVSMIALATDTRELFLVHPRKKT